jgi:3-oxoacyl-[acyl-carrier protein] reductase
VKSKTALVTGSATGIGKAIALELAGRGVTVFAHYRSSKEKAEQVLLEIQKVSPLSKLISFDVSNLTSISEAVGDLDVDILVNNAGIHMDQPALLMSDDNFEKVLRTNLQGPFALCRILGKKMLSRRSGVIVNISSLAGQTGNPGQANYASSKAGLIALTKTLAMELGPRGIRVNAVAPGLIETEMIHTIPQVESYKERIPLKRFGTPEEVAHLVAFLCSEEASYITGQTIGINGGLYPN